jgi:uncharacterized protein (TIGR03083 family)
VIRDPSDVLPVLEAQTRELVALVGELSDDEWDRPSRCVGWTVKDLAAHCEGMMRRLVGANTQAVDGPAQSDRVGYYTYDPDGPREGEDPARTFSEHIRDRVIAEAGERSGGEIRAALGAAADEMLAGVREVPADRVIKRSGHAPLTFGEFVATRVLEFGVHSMDVGHATLRGERVHPRAVGVITGILDGLLGAPLPKSMGWDARTYILTGTGRRHLLNNERFVLGELVGKFPLLR